MKNDKIEEKTITQAWRGKGACDFEERNDYLTGRCVSSATPWML